MRSFKILASALGAALLVVACGGGGDGDQSPRVSLKAVKVMGDSLSDSGTFSALGASSTYGRIFSVQGSTHQIWTERTAVSLGISTPLCNVYQFTGATFVANPMPGCTSFAVGGARINNPASAGGTAAPFSIIKQLGDASAAANHQASDLLLIDGGGNDAADLVGAYLKASTDGGAAFMALLGSLPGTTMPTGAAGFPAAGASYMTTLANSFYDAIQTSALNKGAAHVAILNTPGITNTPRFQMVLDSIAQATIAGNLAAGASAAAAATAGATARGQSEALFQSWVQAFNTQLSSRAAGNSAVVVVDFYTSFNDQIAHPEQFGLTNVKTPACPISGAGTDGLPTYNFETCTGDALSMQTPPAGATGGANWWKTYAFSDGFHPTPYGYQLMGQLVARSLAQAGWL
ncbi:MAG: phospholipase [Gammaproteobacteria bacterium]|uniref:SGNH/GDSL hydrolase family protein n=1 Tax=Rhodoferax sp. TaxID=50421 RepID=UPI0017F252A6|nr:SGNH/GDSL hydrolase family protein [Rhodoferax sp.]MBU3897455.1 phospholipase [Gammaproteobacteria bacterium]MBA3056924.1 phospholipase [Rhodoferax sp.]MBU3998502.1 phospholipase [Gammaproteobacteria bacterium]MBU4018801.1 phospholipase [Gammaproteobacteria bacterium]MBU4079756.1 phospholipase [Gammaproteobacteria bacterium]